MSLKAKIEAVIYASEDPVTLAQLVGLLGQEGQAELDQIAQAQQALALEGAETSEEDGSQATDSGTDVDGLNGEILVEVTAEEIESALPQEEAVEPTPTASEEETPQSGEEPAEEEEPAEATPEEPQQEETQAQQLARESREEKDRTRRLREYFRSLLDQLIADYVREDRGLEIREVAGGYRLATKPEYHDAVRGFVKSLKPPLKLSLQALETLAVVAYKQPITAPEVSEIRGVDSGGVLGSLMTRKLVTTAGRKQVIGRPILYKTTKDFLLRFGLRDINELPSIEEFEKMAGELAEQEEIPMEAHPSVSAAQGEEEEPHHAPETPDELEPERHTHLPQADGSPDSADDPLDDEFPEEETSAEDLPEQVEEMKPESEAQEEQPQEQVRELAQEHSQEQSQEEEQEQPLDS
jgi:segregation and condensation protein B